MPAQAHILHYPHRRLSRPVCASQSPCEDQRMGFIDNVDCRKTVKTNADVILYDNRVVTFKTEGDVILYVVGSADENEILLFNAILALRDSLTILLKSSVDKRTILENYVWTPQVITTWHQLTIYRTSYVLLSTSYAMMVSSSKPTQ